MKTNQLGSYSTMDIVNEVLDLIAKELTEKLCEECKEKINEQL